VVSVHHSDYFTRGCAVISASSQAASLSDPVKEGSVKRGDALVYGITAMALSYESFKSFKTCPRRAGSRFRVQSSRSLSGGLKFNSSGFKVGGNWATTLDCSALAELDTKH
jgi:hypothetical protein